jgi:hypothetical protein
MNINDKTYDREAKALVQARVALLRGLKFVEVEALPETAGEETLVSGKPCTLTVFVQRIFLDQLLVTIQVARHGNLGISYHTESGLVFSPDGTVREATSDELINSGG